MKSILPPLIASLLCLLPACTTAEKAQAKILLVTAGKQIAQEATVATANTGVTLAQTQLNLAQAKLAAAQKAADPTDAATQLKLQLEASSLAAAQGLLTQVSSLIPKITTPDTLPNSVVAPATLTGTIPPPAVITPPTSPATPTSN
jgi:hypothetical protein